MSSFSQRDGRLWLLSSRVALFTISTGIIAALVGLIFLLFREPHYDGRSLSEWLTRLGVHTKTDRPPYPDTAERKRAQEAIGRIGTKALPYLLRWIQHRPPDEKELFRSLRGLLRIRKRDGRPANAELRAYEAAEAFRYVNVAPDSILRELAPLARNRDYRINNRATYALYCLGEHSWSALTVLMTNDNAGHRHHSIYRLSQFSPEQATNAVPYLVRCLKDPEEAVRIQATNSLRKIAPETLINSMAPR